MKLKKYFEKHGRGTQKDMHDGIGATMADLTLWAQEKRTPPPWRAVAIEKYTNGAVTRKDLRPNDYKKIWPDL